MAMVLFGFLLWSIALLDIVVRHKGGEIASKYGLPQVSLPPVMAFVMVAAGAAAIAVGIRGG